MVREEEEEIEDEVLAPPPWLDGLVKGSFFTPCAFHESRKKNEKNVFCLECCVSLCTHCISSHPPHPFLQVRRYVYHDVVRLDDLEKLIDCSRVQPYTINNAKVIFLNRRPQTRASKGSNNICLSCDRMLQDPYSFCSLSCKVDFLVHRGEDLSSVLYKYRDIHFAFAQFEGLRMDGPEDHSNPSSVLEDPAMAGNHSGSAEEDGGVVDQNTASSAETPDLSKKRGFLKRSFAPFLRRRKGHPHRAPFS
ncbi:hypothetical protein AMTRI_Chr02g214080 [Amborella trichopoda]|uniref:B box-type domain-containing protein n=1 Tax=Amborella trichopoda TaxID=13333 RepID=U5D0Y4_AMBTC|nr:uncharacterized protein LOC18443311 [Amborella trichopoda]ERN15032.1 hypothetical protein AMTR_s00032p00241350 [Amborella trichopoda]|eukprot:XP_006853565.1 uncharacterized protein LOC18443311 [Amborella trichopoda]